MGNLLDHPQCAQLACCFGRRRGGETNGHVFSGSSETAWSPSGDGSSEAFDSKLYIAGSLETVEDCVCKSLPRGKMRFKPAEEYQEVFPEHVLPPGLETRMDFDTGRSFARLLPGQKCPAIGGFNDEPAVIERLCEAATWDNPGRLRQLLSSCYYRPGALTKPLCEAVGRGHLDTCEVLLNANADPLGLAPQGVTPLHRAIGDGQELIAVALLRRCHEVGRLDALELRDDLGRTCLEFAREQDLGPMARRLEAAFKNLQ